MTTGLDTLAQRIFEIEDDAARKALVKCVVSLEKELERMTMSGQHSQEFLDGFSLAITVASENRNGR